jgi:hypothetical protein
MIVARPLARHTVAALVLLLAACSDSPTGPVVDINGVEARRSGDEIVLVNHRSDPVFTAVYPVTAHAYPTVSPCLDASRCPPLEPGATRRLPWPRTTSGDSFDQASVSWYHVVDEGDGAHRVDLSGTATLDRR